MGTNVTWNGLSYTVPATSEENWAGATKVDGLLIALVNHGFQKTGGTFTLSADADFGVTAGLKSIYYKSRGTVATTGVLRLGNAEVIAWRNAANSANIPLTVNSSDQLTFNGTVVMSSAGVVPITAGGTGQTTATLGFDALSPMSALGDLIYGGAAGTRTRLAGNTTATLKYLVQTGDGAASAAPAWTQGAFSHLSGNATVAQGGTNLTSYAIGDILYASGATTLAKLGIGTAGQVLKTNGGATAPQWSSAATALAYTAKTHADTGYTILNTDDFILWTLTNTNNDTATLPACTGNTGKVFKIKLAATTAAFNTLTVSRAGSDTITLADGTTGATSLVFYTGGETYELVSDGTSVWQVIAHKTDTPWTSYSVTIGGSTSAPTKATTPATDAAYWRRVGDSIQFRYDYKQNGTGGANGSGTYLFPIAGLTADTAKITAATDGLMGNCGSACAGINGSNYTGYAFLYNSTNVAMMMLNEGNALAAVGSATFNLGSATAITYSLLVTVPISNWKS